MDRDNDNFFSDGNTGNSENHAPNDQDLDRKTINNSQEGTSNPSSPASLLSYRPIFSGQTQEGTKKETDAESEAASPAFLAPSSSPADLLSGDAYSEEAFSLFEETSLPDGATMSMPENVEALDKQGEVMDDAASFTFAQNPKETMGEIQNESAMHETLEQRLAMQGVSEQNATKDRTQTQEAIKVTEEKTLTQESVPAAEEDAQQESANATGERAALQKPAHAAEERPASQETENAIEGEASAVGTERMGFSQQDISAQGAFTQKTLEEDAARSIAMQSATAQPGNVEPNAVPPARDPLQDERRRQAAALRSMPASATSNGSFMSTDFSRVVPGRNSSVMQYRANRQNPQNEGQWKAQLGESVAKIQRKNKRLTVIIVIMAIAIVILFALQYYNGIFSNHSWQQNPGLLFYDDEEPSNPAPTARSATYTLPEIGSKAVFAAHSDSLVADVAEFAAPSSVQVYTSTDQFNADGTSHYESLTGDGSGIVLSENGYILTNYHVIRDADNVYVTFLDSVETPFKAELVGYEPFRDIAVLKVARMDCQPALFGNSSELKPGEMAISMGNSLGSGSGTVTQGIISALDQNILMDDNIYYRFMQTDAAINPGNSGGPLLNSSAEVIGMNTIKTTIVGEGDDGEYIYAEGVGFAIPIDDILPIVSELIENGISAHPEFGILYVDRSYAIAAEALEKNELSFGLLVFGLIKDSPAEAAGLQSGDILTHANGTELKNTTAFVDLVRNTKIGESVEFSYVRNGKTRTADVELGDLNKMDVNKVNYETPSPSSTASAEDGIPSLSFPSPSSAADVPTLPPELFGTPDATTAITAPPSE